jgi:hypothetical protein
MNHRKKFETAIITGGSTSEWVFADPPQGFVYIQTRAGMPGLFVRSFPGS